MKGYFHSIKQNSTSIFVGIAFSLFFIAVSVQAATTISTNIQTDGTLSVTGQSILTGNVGIGTTTPGAKLDVNGNGTIQGALTVGNASNIGSIIIPSVYSGMGPMEIAMGILSNPVVLFGYNQLPYYHLSNVSEPGLAWGIEPNYDDGSGHNKMEAYLQYLGTDNSEDHVVRPFMTQIDRVTMLPTATMISGGPTGLYFGINDGTGTVQEKQVGKTVMKLTQGYVVVTGTVGIGTTTPSAKLDTWALSGTLAGHFIETSGAGIQEVLRIESAANQLADRGVKQTFYIPNGGNLAGRDGGEITVANSGTGVSGAYMILSTENSSGSIAERMRIDSSGNVGIGTTTPSQKLDVNGSINIEGSTNGVIMHDTATASCYLVQVTNGALALTTHACQ